MVFIFKKRSDKYGIREPSSWGVTPHHRSLPQIFVAASYITIVSPEVVVMVVPLAVPAGEMPREFMALAMAGTALE